MENKKEQRDKLSRQEMAGAWTRTVAKEVGNHRIPDSLGQGGGGAHRTIDGLGLWYEGKKGAKRVFWPEQLERVSAFSRGGGPGREAGLAGGSRVLLCLDMLSLRCLLRLHVERTNGQLDRHV